MWYAYGYSARLRAVFVNMPEVLRHRVPSLNIKSIVPLLQNAAEIIAQTEFYIGLQKLDVIGISAYQRKVNKLKGGIGK